MSAVPGAAPWRERAVRFGRHEGLLGLWCEPKGGARAMPVVILGAGILHRIGPSRVSVALARALAAAGHPALRFDLSGIGDSARAPEPTLVEAVRADLRDAIDAAAALAREAGLPEAVALVGFCSGADNALHAASEDPRVTRALLFDPTVHRTAGFHRRDLWHGMTSLRGWGSLLSGRALRRWLARRRQASASAARPPGYYGLLVSSREETDRRAVRILERGTPLRLVLSFGVLGYCNAPEQVAEAMPRAARVGGLEVEWAMHLDHVFGTRAQVESFVREATGWLAAKDRG